MQISRIKEIIKNTKGIMLIKSLWDIEDYYLAFCHLSNESANLTDVSNAIIDVYLHRLDAQGITLDEFRKQNRKETHYVRKWCDLLYNDPNYWCKQTKWEPVILEKQRKHEEKQCEKQELGVLYSRLGLSDRAYPDIIQYIWYDRESSQYICAEIPQIKEIKQLYNLCSHLIIPRIKTGQYYYRDYVIMRCLSRLVFQDPDRWIVQFGISYEEISQRVFIDKYIKSHKEDLWNFNDSPEEWFRNHPDAYKQAIIEEIKKQGGSEEDIALVSDELVKNNLMDGKYRSPGDVARAILQ